MRVSEISVFPIEKTASRDPGEGRYEWGVIERDSFAIKSVEMDPESRINFGDLSTVVKQKILNCEMALWTINVRV